MKYYVLHKELQIENLSLDKLGFISFPTKELAQAVIDRIPKDKNVDQKKNYYVFEVK